MINIFCSSRAFRADALALAALCFGALAAAAPAWADECTNRGRLDPMYCDADGDLVADPPKDANLWKSPDTLIFTFIARGAAADYETIFHDFRDHLAKATGKKVFYIAARSRTAEVEAMRDGRLHIASFPAGFTGFAVNLAGFVPLAVMGGKDGFEDSHFVIIVRKDSPHQVLSDLKGGKVAHSTPLSNSGNLYPRALLPKHGLVPGQDYEIVYSGDHGPSVLGVGSGAYDAAFVAADVFARICAIKTADCDRFRTIYRTGKFPPQSFGIAHDLHPELAAKIKQAFMDYRFTPEMRRLFAGADRFVSIDYKKDWAIIRTIEDTSGITDPRAEFEKRKAEEAEAVRKRQETEKQKKK